MNYFIPNYVVRGNSVIKNMFDDNLIKQSDVDKVLSVFIYLYTYTARNGNIRFTLVDLIEKCGFTSRAGKGESNEKFKSILHYLNVNNYFKPNQYDFSKIKPNQFVEVTPQYFNTDEEGKWKSFFVLTQDEINKINSVENVDNSKLILLYSCLKSMINPNTKVCYPSAEDISNSVLLSEDVIYKYIDELVSVGLIYYDNAGVFYKNSVDGKKYSPANNTYTLTETDSYKEYVDQSIEQYVSYMVNLGWKRSKKIEINNRELAGTINRLIHLKETKGLTKKQEKTLQDAINKRNLINGKDRVGFENGELLDKNKGKLLSYIFGDMFMDDIADKYYGIELGLGLIDDNGDLLVDWEYYKWIMVNYDVNEHDKYVNYVEKYKRDNGKNGFTKVVS